MRDAINNNPVVQISVLGGLLLIGAITFMMRGGGEEAPAPAPVTAGATASPLGGGAATPEAPVDPAVAGSGSAAPASPASSSAAPVPAAAATGEFEAGPGLPAPVVKAHESGDAVVLLVYRGGAIEDRLVRRSVRALSADSDVSVFVTRAKNIARYSQIANGVGVTQVPALIVVRPQGKGDQAPEAVIRYGFRSHTSVVQAVQDALYKGPRNLPYHPG